MSRFNFSEGKLGDYSTIILRDTLTSANVEIALRGANVLGYHIPVNGSLFNIIDGYSSAEEIESQKGARSCIMAPFSNRIENGEYEWRGEKLKIDSPIPSRKEVIHGFARIIDFKVQNVTTNDSKAELTLITEQIRPGVFRGYPFSIDIIVKFTLLSSRLLVDVIMKNTGDKAAPCGCGWHPYFKTSETGVDHLILTIPGDNIVRVNKRLVPLDGDEAFSPVSVNPGTDFKPTTDSTKNVIGKRKVNYCFTGLSADSDGFIRTSIYDPGKKLKISVFQKGGVFYAYTGDEVVNRPRNSIALEPVQYITNAFNRPELKEVLAVQPGGSSVFSFGVEIEQG